MSLPVGDWQFWVVTLAALAALAGAWLLLRPRPGRRRLTELTIGGRKVSRRRGARSGP